MTTARRGERAGERRQKSDEDMLACACSHTAGGGAFSTFVYKSTPTGDRDENGTQRNKKQHRGNAYESRVCAYERAMQSLVIVRWLDGVVRFGGFNAGEGRGVLLGYDAKMRRAW